MNSKSVVLYLCPQLWERSSVWYTCIQAHALTHMYAHTYIYVRICLYTCVYVFLCLVAQWCMTLCYPMDCSSSGSSVHGVSQARILEWVAISFSRGSSRPRDQTFISCVSCIAGGFFTCWATGEAPHVSVSASKSKYLYLNLSLLLKQNLCFCIWIYICV